MNTTDIWKLSKLFEIKYSFVNYHSSGGLKVIVIRT